MESLLGYSPGKWSSGSGSAGPRGSPTPGSGAILKRTLVLFLIAGLPVDLVMLAEVKTDWCCSSPRPG